VSGRLGIGERVEGVVRFRDDGYSLYGTDEDGRYKIFGLVPGRYVLHTVGDDQVRFPARKEPPTEWVSGNVEVSTLEGSVTGFDLHLVRAGVLVLGNAPKLQPDSRCTILDAHGDLLRSSGFYPGFVPRFLLPPGPCTLVLCDADGVELARQALHIGPGVNELDLTR
jgi:hypothetical protein